MERPSLMEAIRQQPRPIEHLEWVRETSLKQMDKMTKVKLEEEMLYFYKKLAEEEAMLEMLRASRYKYPKLITDEKITYKERLILLYEGLIKECEARL